MRNTFVTLECRHTHGRSLEVIPIEFGAIITDVKVKNSEFIDISSRFAAGGTRSTVPDLLKFAKGIMEGKLVSPETTKMMSASISTRTGRLTNYGMGWETTPYSGRYMLVHSGGQQETRTSTFCVAQIAIRGLTSKANLLFSCRLFQLLTPPRSS